MHEGEPDPNTAAAQITIALYLFHLIDRQPAEPSDSNEIA